MRIFQFYSYFVSDQTIDNSFLLALLLLMSGSFVGFSQQTEVVDFIHMRAQIEVYPNEERIVGSPVVRFEVLQHYSQNSKDQPAIKLEVQVKLDGSVIQGPPFKPKGHDRAQSPGSECGDHEEYKT